MFTTASSCRYVKAAHCPSVDTIFELCSNVVVIAGALSVAVDSASCNVQECQQSAVNQPTWTGRSGAAGLASGSRPRFGTAVNPCLQASNSSGDPQVGTSGGQAPRSAQLLARMQNRQQGVAGDTRPASQPELLAQRISSQLVRYLEDRGGVAPSGQIIEHFRSVGERHAGLFRQLLQQLASLQRSADGTKTWTLKQEFATNR